MLLVFAACFIEPISRVHAAVQLAAPPPASAGIDGQRDPMLREIKISPRPLPRPVMCVGYSQMLTASGGFPPYSFSVVAGALPAGLTLTSGGLLHGVATTAGASAFTLRVIDSRGRRGRMGCVLPVSVGYRATDDQVELVIPPLGSGGSGVPTNDTTSSSLDVSGVSTSVAVFGVDVHVTLVHARDSDLVLSLVTPDGTRIALATQLGGSGTHYLGTTFSDRASSGICSAAAPFTGTFRPERPIGIREANGTWTLEIEDTAAGGTGRLLDWSVELQCASTGAPLLANAAVWSRSVTPWSDHQGIAMDATNVYLSAGSEVRRFAKSVPWDASGWTRTLTGITPGEPVLVDRVSGDDIVVLNASDGFIYGLDTSDSTTQFSRDLRRVSCSGGDTLKATPVVQRWQASDCTFRNAVQNEDLIIVGTAYGCGTTTSNRVYALRASNFSTYWTFNTAATNQVDQVLDLTLDVARNRVYVVSDQRGSGNQATLWLLDSITGARLAFRNLGPIDVDPILGDRGLYVLSRDGTLHRVNKDSLIPDWSLPLGAGAPFDRAMAFDPLLKQIFVVGSDDVLHAISDDGASASSLWTATGTVQVGNYQRIAVAPFLGKLYVTTDRDQGRVYQCDESTGTREQWCSLDGDALEITLDETVGGGRQEARLMLRTASRVERLKIPWSGFVLNDHAGGGQVEDLPLDPPSCDLGLQGGTAPASPSVGETVTDTLSVINDGNRAPRCAEVRAMLPAGMSYLGATISQGTIALEGNEIVARLGTVPITPAIAIEVSLRLDVAGSFPRTYTVSSPDYPDPSATNDSLVLRN